jgi:integrase
VLTFDVQIYSIRNLRRGRKPYQLRWRVGTEVHSRTFGTNTLADGRRSELKTAVRTGEQFDTVSGLPASEMRKLRELNWYQHARAYAEMKWPQSAAKSRMARADALATITTALVTDTKGAPSPAVLRRALSCWAFNFSEHRKEPAAEITAALAWIEKKSVAMSLMEDADTIRSALNALALRMDGKPAAATTTRRKRMVFSNSLRYALEKKRLSSNPLLFVDWTPPEVDDEIDWRYVPNPTQAARLIAAAAGLSERGLHLAAFFGCMYYAAMRPAEVTDLRKADCTLPAEGWGELVLAGSSPRVSSIWTDDGKSYEERGLKRRARKTTRPVPIPPELVKLLRDHIEKFGIGADGRVFRASEGGHLLSKEYSEVWKRAREQALTPRQVGTPFAEVPYSLRHAGVSLWLASGVDPVEVARRAGHSVAVLYRFYAKVLDGKRDQANEKIERALKEAREDAEEAME